MTIRSVFKRFDEVLSELRSKDLPLKPPATDKEKEELVQIAEEYSNKTFTKEDAYPNPFIVVEGLDGVGKYKN